MVITLSQSGHNLMDVSAWSLHCTVCAIANTLIGILLHPRDVIFADIIPLRCSDVISADVIP